MDRAVALQMLRVQKLARENPCYLRTLSEYEVLDTQMKVVMSSLTRPQKDTISMFCGVLAELNRYQLEIACELSLGKE